MRVPTTPARDVQITADNLLEPRDIGAGIRVASFFSGAGGLDLGFDLAGFDVVYATDYDELSCRTIELNLGKTLRSETRVVHEDIRDTRLGSLPKNIDLVVGGPPCQSFSASGRRAGGAAGTLDLRGTLFETYCKIVEHLSPKAFLFENVRGILGTNKGEDWKAIVQAFTKIGYTLDYRILDALDYGAPQQRERMILVGRKDGAHFSFPRPLFGPDSLDGPTHVTAAQALKGVKSSENLKELALASGKYSHLLEDVPEGENYLYFTAKRGYPRPIFAYRSRFSDFLYKADRNRPVKTLIASPGKYTGPFHWDSRCFTIGEYKRLQGFPDEYLFVGERADVVRQIGNSVSPKMAYVLACSIAAQVFARPVGVETIGSDVKLTFDKRKSLKAKQTRARHEEVSSVRTRTRVFESINDEFLTLPSHFFAGHLNTSVSTKGSSVHIEVHSDDSKRRFATMVLSITPNASKKLGKDQGAMNVTVEAFGANPQTVQTMWNALDNWVMQSSRFHSLFELYGHFTEPHPIFTIDSFKAHSKHPILKFARHISNLDNCSAYFTRAHLVETMGDSLGNDNFLAIVKTLRSFRFDIRCKETNIAMPQDVYMVAYPFTLPYKKQMNFSVAEPEEESINAALLV